MKSGKVFRKAISDCCYIIKESYDEFVMLQISLKRLANYLESSSDHQGICEGISVDSRQTKAKNVFFALPGNLVDGHQFLLDAANKGAIAAVVQHTYSGPDYGLKLIKVNDVLHALQLLAKKIVGERSPKVIGVTGSVGKTTTKEFIGTLLKQKYRVSTSFENYNSQIGLPLTIVNHTTEQDEILVLEMGMSGSGQIRQLVEIVPPDLAVITNVSLVHACYFQSLSEIADAKGEILSHPKTQVGILPYDDENFHHLSQIGTCIKVSFSVLSRSADYFFEDINENQVIINESKGEKLVDLGTVSLLGKHNRCNLLIALACARCIGLSWEEIKNGLPQLSLPKERLEKVEIAGIQFINDSYNASPISVKAALCCLPTPVGKGRRIAVLGDMLELGKFSQECHKEVGEIALKYVDVLYCMGEESQMIYSVWRQAKREAYWFKDLQTLSEALHHHLQKDDLVLIKGSRSTNLGKLIEYLNP